jgi:hypothetical protein
MQGIGNFSQLKVLRACRWDGSGVSKHSGTFARESIRSMRQRTPRRGIRSRALADSRLSSNSSAPALVA